MPELPEVETMRRGVAGIAGASILDVERKRCKFKSLRIEPRLDAFRRRVKQRRIETVGRLGKRVLLPLEGGDAIVFEPRMTGLILLTDPPDQEHLRFCLRLSGEIEQLGYWDRRGLGSVRLMTQRQLEEQLGPAKLGPDALSITARQLQCRLGDSRRMVKAALLDQRAVAGIGNLYASEILHVAAVHPQELCNRLDAQQWRRIHQAIGKVLNEAIQYEGSTLSDGTYRNALNQAGGYQVHHRVYARQDKPCLACADRVVKIVQAQRATFFCPTCQPRGSHSRTDNADRPK